MKHHAEPTNAEAEADATSRQAAMIRHLLHEREAHFDYRDTRIEMAVRRVVDAPDIARALARLRFTQPH
jgi:hypothetical protein